MIPNLFHRLNQISILTMLKDSNFYSTIELVIGQVEFKNNFGTSWKVCASCQATLNMP